MNERDVLKEFLADINWFKKKKRTLEEGKRYIFRKKALRLIHIRNFHDFDKHNYCRARGLGLDEDESRIRTHSYPPKEFNQVGRCNLKSKPVLYAALDPVTALYEYLNTGNSGDLVHISLWKLKKNTSIGTFNIMPNPNHDSYTSSNGKKVNYSKKSLDTIFNTMIELYNDSNTYEFSAPFSYYLLYMIDICKMIQYPSVTTDLSKCVAINIDFFDQNFYLKKVFKLKVHDKIKPMELEGELTKGVIVSDLQVGKLNGQKIEYGEPDKEDMEYWNYYRIVADGDKQFKFAK